MKVLIVDDASFVRMSLKKLLEDSEFDFEIIEAENGEDAVTKYKRNNPDLVIMDITMPEMDGIEAVSLLKEFDSSAKVIMCSSMGYQEKVLDAIQAGALDFIVKPYDNKKVLDSVCKVLKLK